jgi:hypothetical protein
MQPKNKQKYSIKSTIHLMKQTVIYVYKKNMYNNRFKIKFFVICTRSFLFYLGLDFLLVYCSTHYSLH